jgi:hypothetical protein
VFFIKQIWNRVQAWPVIALAILSMGLVAAPAFAQGETYTWTDTSGFTTFTANGPTPGNFTAPASFGRTSDAGGVATYSGTASYICTTDSSSHTDVLTVSIDAAHYNKGKPLSPTLASISGTACPTTFGDVIIDYPGANVATGAINTPATPPTCDQGSLSWLFCPVFDNITTSISKIATGTLTPLLEVKAITPSSTPQLYRVWSHVRDFADVLFIGVFFAVIASTMLQQDIGGLNPYTIKTTWVRLIIAAILVQVSFYITGLLVDIGNVAGLGITSGIHLITNATSGAASTTNLVENIVAMSTASILAIGAILTVSWPVLLPILAGLFIGIFVVLLTIGARFLLISVLIAVSPLAFLAFVLPNTRHFTSDWFKLLFRLILMFPIIIGIFSIAGVVTDILPFATNTSSSGIGALAVNIVKPLIAIAAFLAIPETFKLAGKGLGRVNSVISGTTAKSRGLIKNSQMYKNAQTKRFENRASLMQSLATDSTISSLTGADTRLKRAVGKGLLGAGGLAIAGPKTQRSIQSAYNKAQAERTKTMKEFENIDAPLFADAILAYYGNPNDAATKKAKENIDRKAPMLKEFQNTIAGRAALVAQANTMGVFGEDHIRAIQSSSQKSDFSTIQTALSKSNYKEKPHLQRTLQDGTMRPDYETTIKDYSANFISGTLDKGAIEAAIGLKTTAPNGEVSYTVDARSQSMVDGWVKQLSPTAISNFYDPSNRNYYGSREKRSLMLQMIAKNVASFQSTANGRDILTQLKAGIAREDNKDIYMDFYNVRGYKAWAKTQDPQNNGLERIAVANDIQSLL